MYGLITNNLSNKLSFFYVKDKTKKNSLTNLLHSITNFPAQLQYRNLNSPHAVTSAKVFKGPRGYRRNTRWSSNYQSFQIWRCNSKYTAMRSLGENPAPHHRRLIRPFQHIKNAFKILTSKI